MSSDDKVCPRCAETIKRAAVVCRYCGNEFAAEQPAPVQEEAKPKRAGSGIGLGVGLVFLIIFLAAISDGTDGTEASAGAVENLAIEDLMVNDVTLAEAETPTAPAAPAASVPKSDWSVSSSQDEVRGKAVHFARVTSENQVHFDFPYAGGSRLQITVRKHPQYGDDAIFQISDGQFVCGIYDCAGTINFGNGPEKLTLVPPEDHDSKTLFAKYGGAIIGKLKSSEKVIVELPFYQEGNRQFTFETDGLEWPPKS